MLIQHNLAQILTQFKNEHGLSFKALARLLDVSINAAQGYCKGTYNLRTDTLELILRRINVPLAAVLYAPPSEQEMSNLIVYISKLLAGLPQEDREKGVQIILEFMALLFGKRNQ